MFTKLNFKKYVLLFLLFVSFSSLYGVSTDIAGLKLKRDYENAYKKYMKTYDEILISVAHIRKAYDILKNTKGIEVFKSVDAMGNEAAKLTAGLLLDQLMEAAKDFGKEKSLKKLVGTFNFVSFVGACFTYWDIGKWVAIDITLSIRFLKYLKQVATKFLPAKMKFELARSKYNKAAKKWEEYQRWQRIKK